MVSEKFKQNIDKATDLIISCWDENNPDDGLTFDERLARAINECKDPELKEILEISAEET